ncbi:glycosyltransferase [Bathymodiolus azoricus thioautotrophic gill symbiont]|jgi:glycosyltransferase involved in cell wall biosynthesis|uniref:Group 1 glycosyl transferase n=1 Tax=Bathymodiolus azoricus thioautotrophic gill symbiont TaxID=235205 RepID=A0A1H6K8Z6_9GAMM|nr:glycosyltransferase [Bathymodiolus azoricus thioautotrophic gill symbiont]CAC5820432.1 glycosyltransferase [uncultured Gammaproteobacteria bacterium]CAC9507389.1 glycosyltransferase [uncultured Gammaproteobacteria bacterium]CAC9514810.1 glycosyltransferase [uncultured Gammaproteobacteria bacterium]CAC9981990.1 glycosyltransferase [uncultured Gammaproteobacteria bacterium]CAC9984317.1 glycosyltransferase [uncultured Gammaproteobacteria bacterium]
MKKLVVVLVIPTLQGNGAERVVVTLATGFAQQGCEVHIILTLKNLVEIEFNGQFKVHYFQQYYRWVPKSIRGKILSPLLDKFIVKKCGIPNLVLSNLIPSDRMLCYSKFNTYLIIHNTMSKEGYSYDEAKAIYLKKPVVCVSQGVKDDFDQMFDSHYPSYCIHNFIDVDFVKQQSVKFQPEYEDYLIHVGGFKEQKGHDVLIKAYHKSGVKNPLVLVGKGRLQEECKRLVDDLGLNDKVIFAGFQSNPYPFIKNAEFMILSSNFEGFGVVIIESLALDTPVISTDCPSGPSEVLPKDNLVPVGDIDALASKIIDVVKNTVEYTTSLKDDFLIENQIKKYLQLVEK